MCVCVSVCVYTLYIIEIHGCSTPKNVMVPLCGTASQLAVELVHGAEVGPDRESMLKARKHPLLGEFNQGR